MARSDGSLGYMPHLDSLRALAVFAVMIHHFLARRSHLRLVLPWGALGVRLFFVLSGFLITGILLECRARLESLGDRPWLTLRRFYVRRFLRIFPVYYLTLAVTALLALPGVRDALWWHAGYATNLFVALFRRWPGRAGHFWSLAVEEQFYLVWPWLILVLPARALFPAIAALAAFAPLFRAGALLAAGEAGRWWGLVLPVGALDALGLGALLAVTADGRVPSPVDREGFIRFARRVGLPALAAVLAVRLLVGDELEPLRRPMLSVPPGLWLGLRDAVFVLQGLAVSLVFVWLVSSAAGGFTGWTKALLGTRPIMYLGTISYGIYLFHHFVPGVLNFRGRLRSFIDVTPTGDFVANAAVTIALAALSWQWFERPINGIKRSFPYVRPAPLPGPRARDAMARSERVLVRGPV